MSRSGDALIEFQDGTRVDVMYWTGPGYRVQWVKHRVVNEKRDENGAHWVKVEVGFEEAGPDENGENKFWVLRDYVRLSEETRAKPKPESGTHFPERFDRRRDEALEWPEEWQCPECGEWWALDDDYQYVNCVCGKRITKADVGVLA